MVKHFNITTVYHRTGLQKLTSLCVDLQTVIWLLILHSAFSSPSDLSAHVNTGLVSPWIITLSYQLQPASSQGVLLLFWSWYTHLTQNPSPSWPGCWLDIPMVFIHLCNCLNRWMWHLQASGHCTQDLWRFTILFLMSRLTPSRGPTLHPAASRLPRDVRQDSVCGFQLGVRHHHPWNPAVNAHPTHCAHLHLSVNLRLLVWQEAVGEVGEYCIIWTNSTGAPQGCVLSLLFFFLYTNDCTSGDPSVKILNYTDNITVITNWLG